MEYFSTRGSGARISASEAIAQGLAPDGGLFVPAQLPPVTEEALRELLPLGYGARAKRILSMYLPEYPRRSWTSSSPPPTERTSTPPP
ncbi:MAG: hypothetical protein ACLTSG_08855 [Lachnospiraceae bacterium]